MTIENPQYYYDKSKGYNAEADSQYNAYKIAQANVAELAGMNNPNRISGEIQKIRDYNKPLLEQQSEIVEKQNQIASKYRGPSNLLWSQQEQLMNQELGSNRKEAQALGAYMVARSGSLADIVNSWQNAFNARFGATKETAELAQNAWDMAFKQQDSSYDKGFGIEKQQTADKQWKAEYDQKERLSKSSGGGGGNKLTKDDKESLIASALRDQFQKDSAQARVSSFLPGHRENVIKGFTNQFPEFSKFIKEAGFALYSDGWEYR